MTLGVAGSTLEHLLGLKNLPHGYCLPLSLRGTAQAPVLELSDLSRRLARWVGGGCARARGKCKVDEHVSLCAACLSSSLQSSLLA